MLISKQTHLEFVLFFCFYLFLHKLASNKPGKNWAVTINIDLYERITQCAAKLFEEIFPYDMHNCVLGL